MPDEKSKRPGTVFGPRNEDHGVRIPTPRGVGLTKPMPTSLVVTSLTGPAKPMPAVVPRNEFDFEQRTPPAMDPNTYHALQTMRAEVLSEAQVILNMLEAQNDARARREAAERAEADARAERRRRYIVPIITALGIAIAGIVAAVVHGCS